MVLFACSGSHRISHKQEHGDIDGYFIIAKDATLSEGESMPTGTEGQIRAWNAKKNELEWVDPPTDKKIEIIKPNNGYGDNYNVRPSEYESIMREKINEIIEWINKR